MEPPPKHYLRSYDVVSLFTNVLLSEAIDLACHYVYETENQVKPSCDVCNFRKLLKFATQGEFMYKDKVYRLVDGVAMGSPLAPTLANLFLAHYDQGWNTSAHAPIKYFRYVDNISRICEG